MLTLKEILAAALVASPILALAQAPSEPAKPPETQKAAEPATPAPAAEPAKPAEKAKSSEPTVKVTPYGFVLANGFWSDKAFTGSGGTATSRADDYPFSVNINNTVAGGGAFLASARQSRIGVRLALKDDNWTRAEFAGQVEFDFKAGHLPGTSTCTVTDPGTASEKVSCPAGPAASTSWNAGVMRLRIATATAIWKTPYGNFSLLAGQDYGLVNPLFAESASWVADPVFWQAGNLWRRSPQFRATLTPQVGPVGVSIAAAILSPADAGTPVDFGQGNASRQPDLEARVAGTVKPMKDVSATVGVSGHSNTRRFNPMQANETNVHAQVLGADADVNATKYLQVKGEWYLARGADDTYNAIAAGVVLNRAGTNYVALKTNGWWGQAIVKPIPEVWLVGGYGMTEINEGELRDVTKTDAASVGGARQKNAQIHAGVIFNAGKFWRFAGEMLHDKTTYLSGTSYNANMYALSSMFRF